MRKKSLFRLIGIAFLVILVMSSFAGCIKPADDSGTGPRTNYPMEVVDSTGRNVTIAAKPERFVSLAPSNTEMLYTCGLESKLVGVTTFCNSIFVPFKRYSAAVIESVIEGKAQSVPYDERTRQKFRAWYKAVKSHLQGIWQQQVKEGFASPDIIPNFASLVRATVNSGNWLYHPFGRVGYAL
ncbi:MAG: hypothetical protein ACOX4K_09465 [Bacillota bacterium]